MVSNVLCRLNIVVSSQESDSLPFTFRLNTTTVHPGTTKDVDFYAAPPRHGNSNPALPPHDGWMVLHPPSHGHGIDPAPTVYPKHVEDDAVIMANAADEGQGYL